MCFCVIFAARLERVTKVFCRVWNLSSRQAALTPRGRSRKIYYPCSSGSYCCQRQRKQLLLMANDWITFGENSTTCKRKRSSLIYFILCMSVSCRSSVCSEGFTNFQAPYFYKCFCHQKYKSSIHWVFWKLPALCLHNWCRTVKSCLLLLCAACRRFLLSLTVSRPVKNTQGSHALPLWWKMPQLQDVTACCWDVLLIFQAVVDKITRPQVWLFYIYIIFRFRLTQHFFKAHLLDDQLHGSHHNDPFTHGIIRLICRCLLQMRLYSFPVSINRSYLTPPICDQLLLHTKRCCSGCKSLLRDGPGFSGASSTPSSPCCSVHLASCALITSCCVERRSAAGGWRANFIIKHAPAEIKQAYLSAVLKIQLRRENKKKPADLSDQTFHHSEEKINPCSEFLYKNNPSLFKN